MSDQLPDICDWCGTRVVVEGIEATSHPSLRHYYCSTNCRAAHAAAGHASRQELAANVGHMRELLETERYRARRVDVYLGDAQALIAKARR